MGLTISGGAASTGGHPPPRTIPAIFMHQEDPTALLKYAKARGFTAITASEYIAAVNNGAALPAKPYFLSFDDEPTQWVSTTDAALATYGAKATGFISSGYPDGEVMGDGPSDTFFYTDTQPCTWDQLRTLKATGRWDFQNHSRNHGHFDQISTAQRQADWAYSQNRIQTELGVTPQAFCHPQNAYSLQSVIDASAFGFKLVTLNEVSVASLSIAYGQQGRYGRPFTGENRSLPLIVVARGTLTDGPVGQLDTVIEPVGNRIPDQPMDDNSYGIWTVPAGEGSEASNTNGVRFDQPDKSGAMDFRANGTTTNVSTQTKHLIAVEQGEKLTFTYLRQCVVSTGNFIVRLKEYNADRAFLQNVDIETLTGTATLAANDVTYTPAAGVYFVKVDVRMVNPPSNSSGTFNTPFLGRLR